MPVGSTPPDHFPANAAAGKEMVTLAKQTSRRTRFKERASTATDESDLQAALRLRPGFSRPESVPLTGDVRGDAGIAATCTGTGSAAMNYPARAFFAARAAARGSGR